MISTTDDRGLINNFSKDPKSYPAEYPTPAEQRTYWIMGIAGTFFMTGVIVLAFAVS